VELGGREADRELHELGRVGRVLVLVGGLVGAHLDGSHDVDRTHEPIHEILGRVLVVTTDTAPEPTSISLEVCVGVRVSEETGDISQSIARTHAR